MGRHANRATRAVLLDNQDPMADDLRAQDPELRQINPDTSFTTPGSDWNEQISQSGAFIVDPQGYLVMTYTAPLDGTGIRKDLNHLLKWTDDS